MSVAFLELEKGDQVIVESGNSIINIEENPLKVDSPIIHIYRKDRREYGPALLKTLKGDYSIDNKKEGITA